MTNNTAESWETTARVEAENRRILAAAVIKWSEMDDGKSIEDFDAQYEYMVALAKGLAE